MLDDHVDQDRRSAVTNRSRYLPSGGDHVTASPPRSSLVTVDRVRPVRVHDEDLGLALVIGGKAIIMSPGDQARQVARAYSLVSVTGVVPSAFKP